MFYISHINREQRNSVLVVAVQEIDHIPCSYVRLYRYPRSPSSLCHSTSAAKIEQINIQIANIEEAKNKVGIWTDPKGFQLLEPNL